VVEIGKTMMDPHYFGFFKQTVVFKNYYCHMIDSRLVLTKAV